MAVKLFASVTLNHKYANFFSHRYYATTPGLMPSKKEYSMISNHINQGRLIPISLPKIQLRFEHLLGGLCNLDGPSLAASSTTISNILDKMRLFYQDNINIRTCACCDADFCLSEVRTFLLSENAPICSTLRLLLPWQPDIPQELKDLYDVGLDYLKGIALSKAGILPPTPQYPEPRIQICSSCEVSLNDKHNLSKRLPPKMSLANNMATGWLPEHLAAASVAELRLTSISSLTCVISGWGRKTTARSSKLYSHVLSMLSKMGPAAKALPRRVLPEEIQVIFGHASDSDKSKAKQRFLSVSVSRVEELILFYKKYNRIYKDIDIDATALHTLGDSLDPNSHLIDDPENINLVSDAAKDADRVGTTSIPTTSDVPHAGEYDDDELVETNSFFVRPSSDNLRQHEDVHVSIAEKDSSSSSSLSSSSSSSSKTCSNITPLKDPTRFQVLPSNVADNQFDSDCCGRTFPHLFPYGEGLPFQTRRVSVCIVFLLCFYYFH
jgi:hypothetical protein